MYEEREIGSRRRRATCLEGGGKAGAEIEMPFWERRRGRISLEVGKKEISRHRSSQRFIGSLPTTGYERSERGELPSSDEPRGVVGVHISIGLLSAGSSQQDLFSVPISWMKVCWSSISWTVVRFC